MVPDSLSKLIVDEIIKSIGTGSDSDVNSLLRIFLKYMILDQTYGEVALQ